MNSYITLDSYKYSTTQKRWAPTIVKPGTVRFTIEGAIDATYAPNVFYVWTGEIRADASPAIGYGSIDNLKATLVKRESVTFYDHYGNSHTVHIVGDMPESYLQPDWANSLAFVQVRITGTAPIPSPSPSPSSSTSPSASESASPSSGP